jgi:hypothetical protein
MPLRAGELSTTLILLARSGGQLTVLELVNMRAPSMGDAGNVIWSEPSDALGLELAFAAPHLQHLHTLTLCEVGSLEYVPSFPSLRQLHLWLSLFPSATKLALLLSRLPNLLCCIIQPHFSQGRPEWQVQNESTLPQLRVLAQQCPRLTIKEP